MRWFVTSTVHMQADDFVFWGASGHAKVLPGLLTTGASPSRMWGIGGLRTPSLPSPPRRLPTIRHPHTEKNEETLP